jgi:CopG family transcriptional regulator, nickel-responsive regulator
MQRITITIDDDLLATLDKLMERRGYASRSEALRDLCRDSIGREKIAEADRTPCIATLTYVFDHQTRELPRRLAHTQHHRHDLIVSTMHVHLDHDSCLEVTVLRGTVSEVRALADSLTAQRGVRFGSLNIVPAGLGPAGHHPAPGQALVFMKGAKTNLSPPPELGSGG